MNYCYYYYYHYYYYYYYYYCYYIHTCLLFRDAKFIVQVHSERRQLARKLSFKHTYFALASSCCFLFSV